MVPRSFRFNHVVGVDTLKVHRPHDDAEEWLFNVICWGTNYQQIGRVIGPKTPENTYGVMSELWIKHYGVPEICVMDQGTEFRAMFQDKLNQQDCVCHVIDLRAPWQNGKTERHGGWWKTLFDKGCAEAKPMSEAEYAMMINEVTMMKNRHSNRSGYSPTQRVLGTNLRLPGALLSDDPIDPAMLSASPHEEFMRAAEIRNAAQLPWS